MTTLTRDYYRTISTNMLQHRLQRATDRVRHTDSLEGALSDLFTIDEIETVLKERKADHANSQLQALAS